MRRRGHYAGGDTDLVFRPRDHAEFDELNAKCAVCAAAGILPDLPSVIFPIIQRPIANG